MGFWPVSFRRRSPENAEAAISCCGRASSWTSEKPPATAICRADRRTTRASEGPANPCPIPIEFICPTREFVHAEAITGDISALARLRICDWSMLSRLDSRSRAVLDGFARRLCLAVWLALLACYIQRWPYQDALGLFQLMCTAAAFGAMALALWKHEHLRSRTLTLWDEGMAFNALSLLTHGLARHMP
jgi:hypothetical protein